MGVIIYQCARFFTSKISTILVWFKQQFRRTLESNLIHLDFLVNLVHISEQGNSRYCIYAGHHVGVHSYGPMGEKTISGIGLMRNCFGKQSWNSTIWISGYILTEYPLLKINSYRSLCATSAPGRCSFQTASSQRSWR